MMNLLAHNLLKMITRFNIFKMNYNKKDKKEQNV